MKGCLDLPPELSDSGNPPGIAWEITRRKFNRSRLSLMMGLCYLQCISAMSNRGRTDAGATLMDVGIGHDFLHGRCGIGHDLVHRSR